MKPRVAVVYSEHYQIDMGGFENLHLHPQRYDKTYLKLQREGLIRPEDVFAGEPVTREQILLVHSEDFLASLEDPSRIAEYVELPVIATLPVQLIDASMLNALRHATGGTIEAARLALQYGIAINIGGGYHHANPHAGEGFCIYNDVAIAIRVAQGERRFSRALVVDLDVHQGNGTALCFKGDDDVFTFSLHEGDIYPIPKEESDLDVELPPGTGDAEYLRVLAEHLPKAIEASKPDIALLVAGVDVLENDPIAYLRMTPEGVVERDALVIDQCVSRNIPIVMVLAGGYSDDAWEVQYASIRRTIETYGLGRPA